MKKVCIVTAARSEYGLLRWVIDEVHKSEDLELQLVVTGGHLSEEQGYTFKAIEADGYPIAAKVNINVDSSSQISVCKTMATCIEKMYSTNILTVESNYDTMLHAVENIHTQHFVEGLKHIDNLYGDGHSSERIVKILKDNLYA